MLAAYNLLSETIVANAQEPTLLMVANPSLYPYLAMSRKVFSTLSKASSKLYFISSSLFLNFSLLFSKASSR
jgi:hypothetical protein